MCFSEPDGPVARITEQLLEVTAAHFDRRIGAIRTAIEEAGDFEAAGRALLELAVRWTPDGLATHLGQALELARLEGRESVFAEADEGRAFSEPDFGFREIREEMEFLRQKRGKPTRSWTDAMHGEHDRAFVVAGVTDMAMLEEFHAALLESVPRRDYNAFAAEFDRLVEKYGWSYNGGREWRIRTIFETNVRTAHMAGRLKQMRDPDMVKLRPYWQYVHGETRQPLRPRPQHLGWDGLVLRWDDPWWNTHFPPNDWQCSCGVRTLSERQLKRLGKTGPDKAPEILRKPYTHRATGQTVQLPEGIGYGWDYMPGSLWEQGLVPSQLIEEGGGLVHEGRHAVVIDQPTPVEELLAAARPFVAKPLPEGLPQEDYVREFLRPFGADIGRAVLWEDPAGTRIPISDQFFRDRDGLWKVAKRGREVFTPLLAEALLDPDEIWLGVAAKQDPVLEDHQELLFDRRYIRADRELGLMVVMEIGRKWWEPITAYQPTRKSGRPDFGLLHRRRGGKLLWKRR